MSKTFVVGQRKRIKVIMSHQLHTLATSGWILRQEGTAGVIYIYLFTWAFWTCDWLGGIFSLKPFDYRWLTRVNTCIDKMVEVCPDKLKVKNIAKGTTELRHWVLDSFNTFSSNNISNKYEDGFMAGVSYSSVLFLIKFLFIVEIVLFVCSCMLVRARSSFVM